MSTVLKDKIKIDKNFISDLIAKSWEESESLQNQIDSIEADSAFAIKTVKLLKDLLTSYYVFTGCLENIEDESAKVPKPSKAIEQEVIVPEKIVVVPEKPPVTNNTPDIDIFSELDIDDVDREPFEYFVDFDEPVGEPLTDDDLYN